MPYTLEDYFYSYFLEDLVEVQSLKSMSKQVKEKYIYPNMCVCGGGHVGIQLRLQDLPAIWRALLDRWDFPRS